ncbi:MAG: amidohydrolase family protein [Eubacteriales bacterium]|nr:amidohydrolase family protein [Eubacteriales bacterium]
MALFQITGEDQRIFDAELSGFLPNEIFDIHSHLWLESFWSTPKNSDMRAVSWPYLVARDNSVSDLDESYKLLFSGRRVVPMVFANPEPDDDIGRHNDYVRQSAEAYGYPALYFSHPNQSAAEVERKVLEGGFLGLKSYLNLAPAYIPEPSIRILDFFPPKHLEVLNRHGWIMMLHIPRPGRLKDPDNISDIAYIKRMYPRIRLILAHVGRAYCREDVGDALEQLSVFNDLLFDFSANCNPDVLEMLVGSVGVKRVMFGSDLPITRMRMRRICENGRYVNLVPPGLYGDVSADPNMREVSLEEGKSLTFFLYREALAMKTALLRLGYGAAEAERVFAGSARDLLHTVQKETYQNPGRWERA